jgi:hypothetical protein
LTLGVLTPIDWRYSADVARGLAQALFVLDHRNAHKSFAVLAIAHSWRNRDLGVTQQLFGELKAT